MLFSLLKLCLQQQQQQLFYLDFFLVIYHCASLSQKSVAALIPNNLNFPALLIHRFIKRDFYLFLTSFIPYLCSLQQLYIVYDYENGYISLCISVIDDCICYLCQYLLLPTSSTIILWRKCYGRIILLLQTSLLII